MAALVGMQPLVDLRTAGPVTMPWSTALFQCGSFSFAGEKAGWARWARWAPPRRARLVRCTATHSTALHMDAQEWSPWSGSVTAYMHTNFGAAVDLFVSGFSGSLGGGRQIRRRSDKGKKESWPAAWSLLQRPRFLEASCLPGCSFGRSNLQLVCLAEAMTIPSNFAGVASDR